MIDDGGGLEANQAASFLIGALALPDDVKTIARELTLVDRGETVTVFAAEFASSVGDAAFLVYLYRLDHLDGDGRRGRERYQRDVETLETAATLDAPGPRLVGHVAGDQQAFILATSPAVWRALRGEPAATAAAAAGGDPKQIRNEQPLELLRLLRAAETAADTWLSVVDGLASDDPTPAEVELSLYLHDERSIRRLLLALNRLVGASRPPMP